MDFAERVLCGRAMNTSSHMGDEDQSASDITSGVHCRGPGAARKEGLHLLVHVSTPGLAFKMRIDKLQTAPENFVAAEAVWLPKSWRGCSRTSAAQSSAAPRIVVPDEDAAPTRRIVGSTSSRAWCSSFVSHHRALTPPVLAMPCRRRDPLTMIIL